MDQPWPSTRRFRRLVQRAYPVELDHLRRLLFYLLGSHPEWLAEAAAAEVVKKAEDLLSMNRTMVAERLGDEFQLPRPSCCNVHPAA